MKTAYIDSSFLVAILFGEAEVRRYKKQLKTLDKLVSSSLLVAEVLSAAKRETVEFEPVRRMLETVDLLYPGESNIDLLEDILKIDYLKGADAFHLSSALWFAGKNVKEVAFLTLDKKQKEVAGKLGFRV